MANNKDARRILILEISAGGHHPTYIRWLLEAEFAESSEIILAARREMFEHPEILACQSRFTPSLLVVSDALNARMSDLSAVGRLRASWAIGRLYRKIFADIVRANHLDFVVVPFLDDCIFGLAMCRDAFAGIPWMAITMRTMFHYAEMGVVAPRQRFEALRRVVTYRILKQNSLHSLLTIDPTLAAYARAQSETFMRKVEYLPDPSAHHVGLPTKIEARLQLGVPPDVPLVLLFGEIAARKGVNVLLEAAADPMSPSMLHILLAGRWAERAGIAESAAFQVLMRDGRLHIVDSYVCGVVERQVLAAADCMWIGYTDFYAMSGVLVLAGRHGIPILASGHGLIGYLTENHAMGMVIDPGKRSSVVGALIRLVKDPKFFAELGENGAAAFGRHDPIELQRLVTNVIKRTPLSTRKLGDSEPI